MEQAATSTKGHHPIAERPFSGGRSVTQPAAVAHSAWLLLPPRSCKGVEAANSAYVKRVGCCLCSFPCGCFCSSSCRLSTRPLSSCSAEQAAAPCCTTVPPQLACHHCRRLPPSLGSMPGLAPQVLSRPGTDALFWRAAKPLATQPSSSGAILNGCARRLAI